MTDTATTAPALSVILITPDSFETIRRTVRCLDRQTVRGEIELLVLAPRDAGVELDGDAVARFAAARLIEVDTVTPTGPVRAAGVRAARASVIAFAEEHAYPAPGWAEALLAAHGGPYAAVGPAIRNANPDTMVSWADLLIGYGPWLAPTTAREMDFLPGHNSSYKRDLLLAYGAELAALLEAETVLQWNLRSRGHRLFLEPAAQTAHTNFGLWSSWIPVMFLAGRAFADTRAREWPRWKRLAFAAASPLIPLVRLGRMIRDARAAQQRWPFLLRLLPTLTAGLIVDGAGQAAGYAFGAAGAHHKLAGYEWHRLAHTPRGT